MVDREPYKELVVKDRVFRFGVVEMCSTIEGYARVLGV